MVASWRLAVSLLQNPEDRRGARKAKGEYHRVSCHNGPTSSVILLTDGAAEV
jgi:hypothetical protein